MPSERTRSVIVIATRLLIAVLFIWLFWTVPVQLAVTVLAAAFLPEYIRKYGNRGTRYIVYVIAIYFALLVGVRMLAAYYAPSKLPYAHLRLDAGDTANGPLIASTGSTWYIGAPVDQTFRGIPATDVSMAYLRSRQRDEADTPILAALWDRLMDDD
jgi:hypothetical protein